eukprot:1146575-Pelagomonas_calceolata.AAC.1
MQPGIGHWYLPIQELADAALTAIKKQRERIWQFLVVCMIWSHRSSSCRRLRDKVLRKRVANCMIGQFAEP